MKIDPWSSNTYQDYTRLRDEFGIEEFSDEIVKKLPNPHKLLRRGVVFGHRGFNKIQDAINNNDPWAILTGLMPSGKMHLGHKMVIDEVIYYQSIGADVTIAVADIESYATRNLSLSQSDKYAMNEYLPYYIALGLKKEKSRIYFQSRQKDVKDLAYILGKKVNWSQMTATYGFTGHSNMTHVFSPLVQTGDILHVQLEEYGGVRPTLVPVGVDQDPHIRLSRDISRAFRIYNITETKDGKIGVFVKTDENIEKLLDNAEEILIKNGLKDLKRITDYKAIYINDAKKEDIEHINDVFSVEEQKNGNYGFIQPSATFHRFMTGLTGDKMSSSKPESAIFLSDDPKYASKKIMNAKTGGAQTLEEHKKNGGKPDECVVYELFLYHLIDDDKQLIDIYNGCKQGKQLCGNCKKLASELIVNMLKDLQEESKKAKNELDEYIS